MGKVRKNNPFSSRETQIISNFSHFTLDGCIATATGSSIYAASKWEPMYTVHANDGQMFSYYVKNGEVRIHG